METIYGGYKIKFNENREMWEADLGELGTRENVSLAKLKGAIERAGKERKKSQKQPAIFQPGSYGGHGGLQDGFVTSRAESTYPGTENEFWTVGGPKNERAKKRISQIFAADDYNRDLILKIKEIIKKREDLDEERAMLYSSLHPFVWKE